MYLEWLKNGSFLFCLSLHLITIYLLITHLSYIRSCFSDYSLHLPSTTRPTTGKVIPLKPPVTNNVLTRPKNNKYGGTDYASKTGVSGATRYNKGQNRYYGRFRGGFLIFRSSPSGRTTLVNLPNAIQHLPEHSWRLDSVE